MTHYADRRPTNSDSLPIGTSTVAVSLADMVPLLLHASRTDRSWLNDFADDVVEVTQDLYEVLVAYQNLIVNRAA